MNILFIVVEDWSANAIGCYGNPIVQTPALDALAKQGIRFDRAYSQSPICNPSRSSFLTGLRPASTRVPGNDTVFDTAVPENAPLLGKVLRRKAGFIGSIGKLPHKWNESKRLTEGFDHIEYTHTYDFVPEFRGSHKVCEPGPGGPSDVEEESLYLADKAVAARLKKIREERESALAAGKPNGWELRKPFQQLLAEQIGDSGLDEDQMEDGRIAKSTRSLLHTLAANKKQFFLSVGFYSTHTPLLAPKKYVDLYDPKNIPLTSAPLENDRGVPSVAKRHGANYDVFNGMYPEYAATPERQREAIAAYYACASYVDSRIGTLLKTLADLGLDKNTIVVVTSDHGFQLGEHGCWSKYTLFEQSTRVPLIVRVPGQAAKGQSCPGIVEMVDFLPTFCDLWNLPQDASYEGLSFMPLLNSPQREWKAAAFSQVPIDGLGRSVRSKRYRYAEWSPRNPIVSATALEFYDLETDPFEQRNLANKPEYAQLQATHKQLLDKGWSSALPSSQH